MAFRVEISPEAFTNLDTITAYLREQAGLEVAKRWFNGIFRAIGSLDEMPERCALAKEALDLEKEVRFLLYGKANRKYQIFFAVSEESQTVQVFHVHHWAMKPLEADELQDLMDESSDAGDDI